jgi:hypothetical protein
VAGVGDIGLPLTERDARSILRQSPSLELGPEHFTLRNPASFPSVAGLLHDVYPNLALTCGQSNVSIELYKLLLYQEGVASMLHQDVPRTKGIFGSLVISLPSKHHGGAVA